MSTGYEFDQGKATRAFNRLSEVAERMQAARKRLKTVGPKTLGTDGLDDACDTFQDEWEDGITRIERASSEIADKLKTTMDGYRTNENETAQGFGAR
ncbi:WXG100 family type VII secretion target [Streptomyces sp. NPDC102384]|uniref:WXG100 family type VII secretion target n=1 Tax=unclassified Streptomyces TaxID=2593676 RepID=UPI00380B1B83